MANRYWVGGTGIWDTGSTNNWSAFSGGAKGASVPTAADSVFFDQAGTYSVVLSGTLTCLDFTVSAGIITFVTPSSPVLTISGSMSVISSTLWPTGSTPVYTFNATTTGKTISTNGSVINGQLAFNGVGGSWTLSDSLTLGANNTTTLTAGTLNLNGYTLTTGIFSSTNSNTRSILFGTGNIVFTHTTPATTVLDMTIATNFTTSGTGGFRTTSNITRTYVFGTTGGTSTNSPNLTFISGGTQAAQTFTTGSWFNKIDYSALTNPGVVPATTVNLNSLTLATTSSYGTYGSLTVTTVGTGTITTNQAAGGGNYLGGLNINCPGGTTTLVGAGGVGFNATTTLTAGTFDLNGNSYQSYVFSSSNSNVRSINFGTTFITLTHTTSGTTVLNMADATNFTYTGTGGFSSDASTARTIVFGTTGGSATNSINYTLTGAGVSGSSIITFTTGSWFKTLDFGTTAFTVPATTLNVNSLILSSQASAVYTNLGVTFRGTGSPNFNGKTIAAFSVNTSGTVTLAAALSCTSYTQTLGTIDFATFNLTCSSFVTYTGGTLSNIGTINCTSWFVTTGTFTMTSGTITPSTSFVVNGFGTFNYNGGTLSPVPTFTHISGTVTLGKAYALTNTGTYTLTAGTLNLNGYDLTTGAFSSSGTSTRSILFGSNNIILNHITPSTGVLNLTDSTNFTWTGTGGFVTDASTTRTCTGGSTGVNSSNAVNLTISGAGTAIINYNGWWNYLYLGTPMSNNGGVTTLCNSIYLSATGAWQGVAVNMRGTGTITSNGRTIGELVINHTGTTTLLDALDTRGNAQTTTLTSGTLNLNGFNLTTKTLTSSNTNVRSINFGTGGGIYPNIVTNGDPSIAMADATNFTWTGTGRFYVKNDNTSIGFGSSAGATTSNAIDVTIITGPGGSLSLQSSWFNSLTFDTGVAFNNNSTQFMYVSTLTLNAAGTFSAVTPVFTRTQTWTSQFSKQLGGIGFNLVGGTLTLDNTQTYTAVAFGLLLAGTLDLGGADLTIGYLQSSSTSVRSIVFGSNNIILGHTTAATEVLQISNATNFSWTGTGGFVSAMSVTRTFTFGITGGSATNAPNLLINSGGSIPTYTDGSWFKNLNFTGSTSAPAMTATLLGINVDTLTLATGGTYTGLIPVFTRTQTWTPQFSKQLLGIGVNVSGGTLTLEATQTYVATTSKLITVAGTIDFASITLTIGSVLYNGTTTFTNIGTISCTTFTVSAGTFSYTTGTIATPSFIQTGGTVMLNAALTLPVTSTYTLTSGTLNLGGFDLTTGVYSSTGTGVRSIIFGTNNIVLAHTTAATTVLSMADVTNFTYTGTGGFTTNASVTRTLTFGTTSGSITNAPNLTFTGNGTAVSTLTVNSWFKKLDFGTTIFDPGTITVNLVSLTLSSGGSFSTFSPQMRDTGTITSNGNTTLSSININGVGIITSLASALTLSPTSTTILNNGTLNLNGFNLTTGIFNANNANTRSIAFGTGNIILAHTTASTTVLQIADATNFTKTGTGGFTAAADIIRIYTFGTTGGTATNSPNLTLTGAGVAIPVLTTGSWFNKLDFGSTVFTLAVTTLNLNALTLSTGAGVYTNLSVNMVGTGTVIFNGKTLAAFAVNNGTGTTTLAAALSCTTFTMAGGTIDLATFTLTCSGAITHSGTTTLTNMGTINCTTLTVSGGTFTMSSGTITLSANSFVITNGTFNYNGGTLSAVATFTHTSGIVKLGKAYALTATGIYTLTAGTLNLNGFDLTTGTFSSNNANPRAIAFGTNNIILATTTVAATNLDMANTTNFSWNGTGGFVNGATDVTRTYTAGTTAGVNGSVQFNGTSQYLTVPANTANNFGTGDFTIEFTINTSDFNAGLLSPSTSYANQFNIVFNSGNLVFQNAAGTNTLYTVAASSIINGAWHHIAIVRISGVQTVYFDGVSQSVSSGTFTDATDYTSVTAPVWQIGYDNVVGSATGYLNGYISNLRITKIGVYTGAFTRPNTQLRAVQNSGTNISAIQPAYTNGTQCILLLNTPNSASFISDSSSQIPVATLTNVGTAVANTFSPFNWVPPSGNPPNLSISSGTAIPTITTGSWFNILNFTGSSNTPAVTTLNVINFILSATGTYTNLSLTMVDTSTPNLGNNTPTFNSKAIAGFNITRVNSANTVTLPSSISCTLFTMTIGTLDFATFNITCSGAITYTTGTILNVGIITCTTWTVNGSFIMTSGTITPSVSFILAAGSFSYNGGTLSPVPTFTHTSGTVFLGQPYALTATGTYTLTAGTLNLNGFDLTTGAFSSDNTNTRSIVFGSNNIILTHTTASTVVLAMATATGFTYTGTGGFTAAADVVRTYSFGSTAGGSITNSPRLSFTGSGTAIPVITTAGWFNTINFGTTAFTLAVTTLNINSLTLSSAVGAVFTNLSVNAVSTGTINCNTKSLATLTINTGTNITTFSANALCTTFVMTTGVLNFATYNLTSSTTATLTAGNLNNVGTVTCTTFNANGGTITNGIFSPSVLFNIGGAFTMYGGTITSTSASITAGTFTYWAGTLTAVTTFTHSAGTLTLNANLPLGTNSTYTLSGGSGAIINLNTFTLTTGIFSSSFATVRTINFGTGYIVLNHTTAGTNVLDMANTTGFAYTGTGGFSAAADIARTFTSGNVAGTAATSPSLFITSGSVTPTFPTNTTPCWFNTLNFTGSTVVPTGLVYINTLVLATGGTYTSFQPIFTRTQTWTAQFSKILAGIGFNLSGGTLTLDNTQTYIATSQFLLILGSLNLGGYDLTIGTFSSNNANTRSVVFGTTNIILATTTPGATNIDMATLTGFSRSGTGAFVAAADIARTFTVGSTAGGTTNTSVSLSINSGSVTPTFTPGSWFNVLSFTGSTVAPTGSTTFMNRLLLSSGGDFTSFIPIFTATQQWSSQYSKVLGGIGFNLSGGTLKLDITQTYTTTSTFILTLGTLDLGGADLTIGAFSSNNANVRAITFGFNNIILTHSTAGTTVLDIPDVTNFTYTGTGGFRTAMTVTRTFAYGTTGGTSAKGINLSLTSGSSIPTINTGGYYNILDFSGSSCTPATATLNLNTLLLSSGGTFSNLTINIVGTGGLSGNGNNGTLGSITMNVAGITTTMTSALTMSSTGVFTLTQGTLNLSGLTLTVGVFSSTGALARSIAFNLGTIALANSSAGVTNLDMANVTNFTWTSPPTGSIGGFIASAAVTRTFSFASGSGGTTSNNPNLTFTGFGTAAQTFTSGSRFRTLNFGTTAFNAGTGSPLITIGYLTLSAGGTFTGITANFDVVQILTTDSNTITTNGNTTLTQITNNSTASLTLLSAVTCVAFSLNAGTIILNGFDLTISTFSRTGTNVCSISFGSTFIVLTGSGAILTVTDATNFTSTGTGGFKTGASGSNTFTWGTTGGSVTSAVSLFIVSGGVAPIFTDGSWFNTLDFTGSTVAPTMSASVIGIYVNTLVLATGGTYTSFIPVLTRTQTWTAQFSKQLGGIGFNVFFGTLTLDNTQTYTGTSQFILNQGTLNLGGVDLTIGAFSSSNSNTRSIVFGSNNIVLANTNAGATNLSMATATNFTWTGTGGFTAAASVTRTFVFGTTGGTTTNSPNLTFTGVGTSVQTITTGSWFNKLDYGSTVFSYRPAAVSFTVNLNSLTMSLNGDFSYMTANMVGTGTIVSGSVGADTITGTLGNLNINHTGTTTLDSRLQISGSIPPGAGVLTLTSGTFNLNGYSVQTPTFSSSNTNTRSIAFINTGGKFSAGIIYATDSTNPLQMAIATGFTTTGAGGFQCSGVVTGSVVFGTTGGNATNAPNLTWVGSSGQFLTMTSGSWFNKLDMSSATSGTIPAATVNVNSVTLSSGGVFTSLTMNFVGNGTLNANGNTGLTALTLGTAGVTTSLGSNLVMTATSTFTLTQGTLNLNGFNLTTGIFSSTNANTRSITFGSNNISLIHSTALTTVLSMAITTGFTYTGTGGFIDSTTNTHTITFGTTGGTNTNAPNLTLGAVNFFPTITTGSWFNTLDFGSASGATLATTSLNINSLILTTGSTFTGLTVNMVGNGTIRGTNTTLGTLNINTVGITTSLATNFSMSATGTVTISQGTLSLNGFTLTTGIFSSSGTATRSISFGSNNIVLAHTTAATTVLSMVDATGFTYTGTGGFAADASTTRTFTFGTTGGTVPNAPKLSITSGASTPTFTDGSWFNTINFTGSTCSPALSATTIGVNVSTLTLATGGTYTSFIPSFTRTQTWTSQFSKQLGGIGFNLVGGTLTLDNTQTYSTTSIGILTNGIINLGGYDLTIGAFISNSANTRAITFSTNNIILNHSVAATTVLSMATATNFTYTGTGGFVSDAAVTRTYTFGTTGGTETNAPNLSITSGASIPTITTGSYFKTLNFAGSTCAPATTSPNLTNLTLSSGGNFNVLRPTITGNLTSNNNTTLGDVSISSVTANVTLIGAFDNSWGARVTLNAGTLNLNGYNLTTATFNGSNAPVRAINFGSNNIVIGGTTTGSVFTFMNATNFTWTGTGGFVSDASITRTFAFGDTAGGSATNAPNLTFTGSGTAVQTFNTGSWFNTLNFGSTVFAVPSTTLNINTLTLSSGGTFTGLTPIFTLTQTWTSQFSKQLGGIGFNLLGGTLTLDNTQTYVATSILTLTQGTLSLTGNITIGTFSSNNTNTRAIAFGTNNITLSTTTAGATNIDMANVTNLTCTGTGGFRAAADITRTFTCGSTGPLETSLPNLTFTGSGAAVQTLTGAFKAVNFGTTAFTPPSGAVRFYGSLTLSSGGNFSNMLVQLYGTTSTLTSNGNATLYYISINDGLNVSLGSTLTMNNAASSGLILLVQGTLNLNGFNLTTAVFSSNNANTRSVIFGSNNITLADITAAGTPLAMADATNFTWTGTGGFISAMSVTRTFTFGTTGGSATNAPNLSINSGASVPTFTDGSWFNNLNFTGSTCIPAVTASVFGIYVSTLTLDTGGTYTSLIPVFTRTQTWTSQFSKQLAGIGVNTSGITLTLDNTQSYTATAQLIMRAGTINFNSTAFTIGGVFSYFGGTITNNTTISVGSLTLNNISLTITSGSTFAVTSAVTTALNIINNGSFNFTGGTVSLPTSSGGITINTGGTLNVNSVSGVASTIINFNTGTISAPTIGCGTFNYTAGTLPISTITCISSFTITGTCVVPNTTTINGRIILTSGSFTYNGGSSAITSFSHTAGTTVTLNSNLTFSDVNGDYTFNGGTLNLNNNTLTVGTFISNNSTTRNIAFGTGNIVLVTTTAGASVIDMATTTNFSWTGTGGFRTTGTIIRVYYIGNVAGGSTSTAVNLAITSGSASQTFISGCWFNTLDFTGSSTTHSSTPFVSTLILSSTGTYTSFNPSFTRTQTWSAQYSKVLGGFSVYIPGGTLTLDGTQTFNATADIRVAQGTLNLGGYDLTTGTFSSDGNSSTKAIIFGSNNIILSTTTAGATNLNFSLATNFTYTGTGGFVTDASITRTFTFGNSGGGTATNSPRLTFTGSGTAIQTFTTGSWFNTLNFGSTAFDPGTTNLNLNNLILSTSGTFTNLTATMVGTGTITPNSNTTLASLAINGAGITTSLASALSTSLNNEVTLTQGTLNLNGFDLSTGKFISNNSNTRSVIFGTNNIILASPTPSAVSIDMATATGFTTSGTGGFTAAADVLRTYTFGTTGGTATNSPRLSFTGSGTAIPTLTTGSYFNKLDFGTTTFTPAVTTLNLNSLTLSSGGTFTNLTVNLVGSGTIISNTNTTLPALTLATAGATTSLGSNFTLNATSTTTLTAGTLNLNGYTLTTGIFNSTNSNTRSIIFGTGNIVLAHTTAATTVLSMADCTGFSYTGTGGFTADASITRTYTVGSTGGNPATAVNLSLTGSGTAIQTFTTSSWFNTLNFGITAFAVPVANLYVATLVLSSGGDFTSLSPWFIRTQTWTAQYSKQLGGMGVGYPSVTLTLDGTQTFVSTSQFTMIHGTLNLGGYDLTVGIFNSNFPNNVRVITFGSNNIILAHPTAATVVLLMTNAFFSYTGTGGFSSAMTVTRTFTCTTVIATAPKLSITSGSAVPTFTGTSCFSTLDFTGSSCVASGSISIGSIVLSSLAAQQSMTLTFGIPNGTIRTNGSTLGSFSINHTTTGTTTLVDNLYMSSNSISLVQGTLNLNNFTAQSGSFASPFSTVRGIAFGTGNFRTGLFSSANFDISTATNFSWTGTGGFICDTASSRSFAFGNTAGGTSVNAPNLTFDGSTVGQTISLSGYWNTLDFGSTFATCTATTFNVNSVVLSPNGATAAYNQFTLTMVGTGTIRSNGKQISELVVNSTSGTTTLLDALNVAYYQGVDPGSVILTSGTLNLGGFSLSCAYFVSTGTLARSIVFGTSNITITGAATPTAGLSMADATNFTKTGTGYFIISYSGTPTIAFGSTGGSVANAPNISFSFLSTASATVTISANSWFNIFDCSSSSVTIVASFVNVNTLYLSSINIAQYSSLVPVFTRSQTWTMQNNKQLGGIGVNGAGVTLKLGDSVQEYSGTSFLYVTAGTLDLNGYDLTIGAISSDNSNTRSIIFGSNNIRLSYTVASSFIMFMNTLTGFTWSGTGGFVANLLVSSSFASGSTAGNITSAPNLTITGSYGVTASLQATAWFNNLDFSGFSGTVSSTGTLASTVTLSSTGTFSTFVLMLSRTQTWTSQYGKVLGGIGVGVAGVTLTLDNTQTYSDISSCVLRAGTLNLGGYDLTIGTVSASNTNTRSIAFGSNNIILATTTASATNLIMNDITNFTWTGTGGFRAAADIARTFSVGSTSGGTPTNGPNLTFTGSGTAVHVLTTNSWFNTLDFGTTAFTLGTTTLNVNTLTLSSGGTFTALTPSFTRTQTWTRQFSKQLAGLTLNVAGVTLTLDGTQNFVQNSTVLLTQGTLTLTGNITVGIFSSSTTTTRAINFGSSNIILNHNVAATFVVAMSNATNFSWTGTGGFVTECSIIRYFEIGMTGGSATNSPNVKMNSGSLTPVLYGWYNILDFTGSTCSPNAGPSIIYVNTLILAVGGTYTSSIFIPILTRTQTWTAQFGKQLAGLGFNLPGGTLTLDNTQTYTATSTFNLQGGTLDLGGTNLTIGIFSSSGTAVKSIAFGSNYIVLAHTTAATTVLNMTIISTSNPFSYTGLGGFLVNMTTTRTVTISTSSSDIPNIRNSVPNLFVASGASTLTINYNSAFNKIDFTGSTCSVAIATIPSYGIYVNSVILATGGTYTTFAPIFMTSTVWTPQFGKQLSGMGIHAVGGSLTFTAAQSFTTISTFALNAGTLNLSGFDLTVGEFLGSLISTFVRSIAFGSNNIILNHTTASTQVLQFNLATNFTWTGTGGFVTDSTIARTLRFGDSASSGTAANAPNLTFTTGTTAPLIITNSWFKKLDFGSTVYAAPTGTYFLQSLTLSTGASSYSSQFIPNFVGTGTIIANGKAIYWIYIVQGGNTTLGSALSLSSSLYLNQGTLNLSGYTLSTYDVRSDIATASARNIVGPGTITTTSLAPAIITNGSGFIGSGYTFTIISNTSYIITFAGAGGSYGTLNVAMTSNLSAGYVATVVIAGANTFENIKTSFFPTTFVLPANTTQTVNAFSASGTTALATVTLRSSIPGTQASISNPNQVISANYLVISDSNATGGASWYANTTSVNGGNNTGWNFTGPPAPAAITGQAFLLF